MDTDNERIILLLCALAGALCGLAILFLLLNGEGLFR